eukprot:8131540-Alexandrium_andersonii.AAC.1
MGTWHAQSDASQKCGHFTQERKEQPCTSTMSRRRRIRAGATPHAHKTHSATHVAGAHLVHANMAHDVLTTSA